MFKTSFHVIFRSAYSQSLLKKNLPPATRHTLQLHCVYVCIFMCVWNIISSVGRGYKYSGNNLLSPLRLLNDGCSSQVFYILTVFFLISALNFRGTLQDNLNIYWHLNMGCINRGGRCLQIYILKYFITSKCPAFSTEVLSATFTVSKAKELVLQKHLPWECHIIVHYNNYYWYIHVYKQHFNIVARQSEAKLIILYYIFIIFTIVNKHVITHFITD